LAGKLKVNKATFANCKRESDSPKTENKIKRYINREIRKTLEVIRCAARY